MSKHPFIKFGVVVGVCYGVYNYVLDDRAKGVVRDTEKEALEPERIAHSDHYLWLMLKAQVARNLFGIDYYYKVMKEVDDGYKKAIEVLAGK